MYKVLAIYSLLGAWCILSAASDTSIKAAAADAKHRIVVTSGVDTLVPQLVDGGGWQTSFFLTNLDSKPVNFALFLSDDRGQPLTMFIMGIGNAATIFGTLNPNASATIETQGAGSSLLQGYAEVMTFDKPFSDRTATPTRDRIAGLAVFRQRVSGRPDYEAVVPFSPLTETQMVLPFDNRNGFSTGLAIVNPGLDSSANVEVVIRSESGSILKQDVLNIPASSKVTFSLPDRFPEVAGRNGRVNLRTSGSFLSALGLRFNPSGAFTSFHALSVDPAIAPPTQPSTPSGALPGVGQTCSALSNAQIYADDGTFLGRISNNEFQSDSIANQYGRYGSAYSSTSIFNNVGTYGSNVSAQSPFNPVASRPPVIYTSGQAVAYLTMNSGKSPRVDPSFVLYCVGRTR